MSKNLNIQNRRAHYDYEILEKFEAGIKLMGTEIKSIRAGEATINEAYCYINKKLELFIKGMHIAEYTQGSHYNHDPLRERKLLLHKRELQKLWNKTREKGFTIIPLKVFINERGFAKVEIALARGKKSFDKRETIKAKDVKREMDRAMKRR